ncbi:unnamed protein product [Dicrocoelium dendriticum]|nr:unnamed protein product [Dicrocoelium dendriticum]
MPKELACRATFCLLDILAALFLLDYLSFRLTSKTLHLMVGGTLTLNRIRVFRALFFLYIGYRVGMFAWRRYKITLRLTRKKEDILDKHGRLNEKLRATEMPVISADEVAEVNMSSLRDHLRSKRWTAVDVIDAYQRRALNIFRSMPGCISEIVFDSDVYAILADSRLEEDQQEASMLSALHGIPVSVQEIFPVRGYDHTMGYVSRTKLPAEEDCAFVAALKSAGAVPFVLTNSRQKFVGLTCDNPIFGRTRHPTHHHRACVSGEAAFLCHHGAPLGFVADIVGEARLSAAFCGLVAFKPSSARMSQKGLKLPLRMPRDLGVIASPIAHTVSDVTDALRALWTTSALFKQDCSLCPLSFDEDKFSKGCENPITVGFYAGFPNLLPVSPAVHRVLQETRSLLESKGYTVVEFVPPDAAKGYQLVMSLLIETLGPETLKLVYNEGHGDILVDCKQRAVHMLYALPAFFKKLLCFLRATRMQSSYKVTAVALRGVGSTKSHIQLEEEVQEYAQLFFNAWNEQQIDCLLCPVSPIPVPWDYSAFYVVNCVFLFTALYNLLGCPAGTVKAGRIEREDIHAAKDGVKPDRLIRQSLMFAQQLDASEGLPVNIQVVAKPWDDELALGLLHVLEQGMHPS